MHVAPPMHQADVLQRSMVMQKSWKIAANIDGLLLCWYFIIVS